MSVLSLVQDHCRIHALNIPATVVNNPDATVGQLFGILNEVLDEVADESKFNVTTQEATFTTIAAEDQGPMSTLAPNGYSFAYFETFFDRTLKRPLYGPVTETEWQELKALPSPGPFYKFRIKQDHLLLDPAPTSVMSQIAFEYASSWAVQSSGGVLKAAITEDTDTFIFPDRIIRKGLAYRWKSIKGLPYQSDETQYYNLLNNYIARDKVKRRINLANPGQTDLRPGVFVPFGNWNV